VLAALVAAVLQRVARRARLAELRADAVDAEHRRAGDVRD